jgi:hypothetical protein
LDLPGTVVYLRDEADRIRADGKEITPFAYPQVISGTFRVIPADPIPKTPALNQTAREVVGVYRRSMSELAPPR